MEEVLHEAKLYGKKEGYPREFGEAIDRATMTAWKHQITKKRMDPSILTFFQRKPKAR